jgi:hypothetical protein
MAYLGNSFNQQSFTPATDFFSGNGVTTTFTLTRPVQSVYGIEVVVNNVQQNPSSAYTINASVQLVFVSAPSAGSNNIYVNYNAPIAQITSVGQGTITGQQLGSVSNINSVGSSLTLQTNGTTAVTVDQSQNVTFGGAGTVNFQNINVNGTSALGFPNGTTGQRPTATTAQYRFNSTTGSTEYSVNGFWINEQNGYTQILGKTKIAFSYTGADQTWTVPAGTTHIFVKMWGAGGGGGSYGGWRQGSTGGSGGYSGAIVPVVAGQTITIRVGGKGNSRPGTTVSWPNGGQAGTGGGDNQYTGSGGASSSIVVPTINSGSPCMFAGGGGGGGSVNGWARNPGGAGGGLQGEDGYTDVGSGNSPYTPFATVGKAGTQTAGGAGAVAANSTGGAGSYNQGGNHPGNTYGGGGGGGYYGGGAGAYGPGASMGGGGGGSGFVHSSLIRAHTLTGVREYPAMANDPDCIEASLGSSTRIGVGGDEGITGGHGLVVFYY